MALERLRSPIRAAMVVAGASLVAFHGWLFTVQAAAGKFEDPSTVVRWALAAALIAALAAIRRSGDSVWSRRGIAVWVLAALLHGPAVATDSTDANLLAPPEAAVSLLQLVSVTALAITLWMLAGVLARRGQRLRLDAGLVAAVSSPGCFSAGVSPRYFSRPPPHGR